MENNRNFLITIAISILILVGWQVLYMNPRLEAQREAARIEAQQQAAQQEQAASSEAAIPQAGSQGVPGMEGTAPGQVAPRIAIDTPSLSGSINLAGARIDDLVLKAYRETVEPNSPNITLLEPVLGGRGYFAELGYVGSESSGAVPDASTIWSVDGEPVLTPDSPVTLYFVNDQGLRFERRISVDSEYMFTIEDQVVNESGNAVALSAYGRATRYGLPEISGFFILHEGLIGVTGEEGLQEIDYDDLQDARTIEPGKSSDGWLGFTDKYWAVALVPPTQRSFQPRYAYFDGAASRFQADYLTDSIVLQPNASESFTTQVFAGAKQVSVIDAYEEQYGIRQFELLIDWGWFHFITKPLFYLMDWLYRLLGNFGLAILATTVIVKALFFPLANKSYVSMANMKKVQPAMMEIREKFKDDRIKQQQAMMELYKKERINPLAGCWPVLIQIPVFFALYKVLFVTIEMRHAPFFGWIRDLAAPDPTSIFNLFGLLPYDVPSFLMIGVWPLIMGITMFLQMRMNPTPPDPTQAMVFNWMPVIFTFMLATFPAGLVIYWAWNNSLSILQQGIIMKRQGAKIELWDNLKGLFSRRKSKQPAE
jgi:YidC/Oxa1 family membrane protein insertase